MSWLVAGASVAAQGTAAPSGEPASFPIIERLEAGVWAALQPDRLRFNDSNSLVVELDQGVLLVDTQDNPQATARLLDWIDVELEKPVRWLVNTHWHIDHIGSNHLVRERYPDVVLLGATSMRADVPGRAQTSLTEDASNLEAAVVGAEESLAQGLGLDSQPLDESGREDLEGRIARARDRVDRLRALRLLGPDIGFSEAIEIGSGERTVQVMAVRAHTDGDAIVYVPHAKVLATGDVVDALPFGGHGHPRSWIRAIDEIRERALVHVVPGHGSVASRGNGGMSPERQLDQARRYLQTIVALSDEARAKNWTQEAFLEGLLENEEVASLRGEMVRDDVAARSFDHFVPETAKRAWEELDAE